MDGRGKTGMGKGEERESGWEMGRGGDGKGDEREDAPTATSRVFSLVTRGVIPDDTYTNGLNDFLII